MCLQALKYLRIYDGCARHSQNCQGSPKASENDCYDHSKVSIVIVSINTLPQMTSMQTTYHKSSELRVLKRPAGHEGSVGPTPKFGEMFSQVIKKPDRKE